MNKKALNLISQVGRAGGAEATVIYEISRSEGDVADLGGGGGHKQ